MNEYPITPVQLAAELGNLPEARPGKKVRDPVEVIFHASGYPRTHVTMCGRCLLSIMRNNRLFQISGEARLHSCYHDTWLFKPHVLETNAL